METKEEQLFKTELEKQVEITILQRKKESIEKKIKRYISWKLFVLVGFLGALSGAIVFHLENRSDLRWERNRKINDYFTNSKIPASIINSCDFELPNYERYAISIDSTTDTPNYLPKQVDSLHAVIKTELKIIENSLEPNYLSNILIGAWIGFFSTIFYYSVFTLSAFFFWRANVNI